MIGRSIKNRYKIVEHVGEGSTATVYKAEDLRLGRDVALKVLLPHVREATRKRFFQEANAVAQLNHPNIMAIFDIDDDDDQPFLVVEYVEGQPLTNYIPSPQELVVELGQQIAQALHYAHERGIIHRDIKPANIKVTPEGQVKIMDLGLALGRESKRMTADGMIIGTPAYLSPEQAQGQTLDQRTDIYSLGIVLYEMATGQLPFDADDIRALLIQQVRQPAPPPRLIIDSLSSALEQVILKTLEKDPNQRFQSCRILAEALRDALTAKIAPDSPTQRRSTTQPAATETIRKTRIILADDHTVLRKALVSSLSVRPDFEIVAQVGDGQSALEAAQRLQPDVLLLDLNMPGKGGLDVLPEIRQTAPNVKVLVLTGREEDWYIMQALRAGANGYILKSNDEDELIEAIIKVTEGNLVLGRGIAERVVTGLLSNLNEEERRLNDLERRLLLYVAGGFENVEISNRLKLTMPLVIETLASAMNKLGAKDRHSAALQALRMGVIVLDDLHSL